MKNTEFSIWLPNEAKRVFTAKPIPDAPFPQVEIIIQDLDARGSQVRFSRISVPIPVKFLEEIIENGGQ